MAGKKKTFIITIDGPAGAGKSTLAKRLAGELGAMYLDTGAMYRAMTLKVIEKGINPKDESAVSMLARETRVLFQAQGRVILDGRDVTPLIRSRSVDLNVSAVSSYPVVRQKMVDVQRESAVDRSVVVEGRDVGSVVFPQAQIKFFLTASLDERARRRQTEIERKGIKTTFEDTREEIRVRDRFDQSRNHSPLVKPENAVEIDSTDFDSDGVFQKMMDAIQKRRKENPSPG